MMAIRIILIQRRHSKGCFMELAGKVATVSGGASGIGKATSSALAARGVKVVIADLNKDGGQATVDLIVENGGEAVFQYCDVTKTDDLVTLFDRAVSEYGSLDIAFNNAGIGEPDFFSDDLGRWKRVIDINLTAMIEATRLAVLTMRRGGKPGAIVNTSSIVGLWPMPLSPVYAAAKAGVIHFTRSLGYLKKDDEIRVNTICPELVDTPLVAPMGDEYLAKARAEGNILQPEEIAAAVIELIEDESRAGAVMTIMTAEGRSYV